MIRSLFASLRARLALLVLLALLPAFALVLYGYTEQRRLATAEAQDTALGLVRTVASNHSRLVDAAHQLLAALAQLPQMRSRDSATCNPLMASLLKQYPVYANLGAADADGNIFCSGVPFQNTVNLADRVYFQRAIQTRDFAVGEYQIGRITGIPGLGIGFPVLDDSQRPLAVVFAAMNLNWFSQVASTAELPAGSALTITDGNHVILARYPDPENWVGKTVTDTFVLQSLTTPQDDTIAEGTGVDGTERLFAFAVVRNLARDPIAYVSVGIPSTVAFADVNQALTRNLIGLGVVTLLALVATWYFGDLLIVRRVNALTAVAEQLRAGNLSARTGETYTESEFGQLARRFDEMAVALQQREVERDVADAEVRKWAGIFQSTQVGIVIGDGESKSFEFNAALAANHGYAMADLKDKQINELIAQGARAEFANQIRFADEKGHQLFETQGLRKDGTVFPLLIDMKTVKDEHGRVLYRIASSQDLSQLRRAEVGEREQRVLAEALHDTAAALNSTLDFDEVLNRVLDNVGRVVPHDAVDIMLVESDIARPVGCRGYAERGVESWFLAQRFPITKFHRLQQMLETGRPVLIASVQDYPGWVDLPETHWIRSLIGIPIRVQTRVIGFLNVMSITPGFFNETHLGRLETFADQIAISLENVRLLSDSEQRANQFSALYELARELATQGDLPGLLQTIVNRMNGLLDAPCGFIYLYNAARNELELAIEQGFNAPVGTRLKMGEGMAGRVAQERQPMRVDDYRTWENRAAVYDRATYAAVVEVPMVIGGELIGVLGAAHLEPSTRRFNEEDVHLLALLAGQAASMVRNTRLLAETEHRASEFAALYQTTVDLSSQQDLPTLLKVIVDRAVNLLSAASGAMYLYDAARGDLVLTMTAHASTPVGTRLKLGEGMAGLVAQTRQPLIVDDYRNWAGRSPQYVGTPLSAILEVPMLYSGDLIGVLVVEEIGETTRKFTEQDARLLSLFAAHTASTIRNARLLAETERRANEFAALYQTTVDLSSQKDLPELLQTIVDRAVRLLSTSDGGMYLYDASRGDLVVTVATQKSTPIGTHLQLGEGMAGRVAQTRQPIIVDDYRNWTGRSSKYEGTPLTAILEVPMLYSGQLVGVLAVEEAGETTRKFTEEDTRLLSLFAAHAASAVHHARLLEETRTRAEQLGLLYDAGLTLNSVLDPRVQLEFLFKIATKALNAEYAEFFRFDTALNRLSIEMSVGYEDAKTKEVASHLSFSIEDERGVVGWVAKNRVPVNVGDVRADPRWIAVDPEIRSGVWVPVQHENELRGVLSVFSVRLNEFSAQDERLLVLFANQVATAMENARLFEMQRQRSAELEALREASLRVTSTLDLPQVLDQIIAQSLKMVSATNAHIFLYDGARLTFGAAMWADTAQRKPFKEPRQNGITYAVARTGVRIVVPDTGHDPLYADESWTSGAILSLPLKVDEQVRGVMNIAFDQPHRFDDNELRVLELLADQATIALENARLFGETRRHADRLAVVNRIASVISQTLNLDELLEVIYYELTATFKPDAFFIALYDAVKNELDYRIDVDQGVREPPRRRSLQSGFGAHVIKTQHSLLVRDWEKEKDHLPPIVLAGSMQPSRSWLGVPMRIGDTTVGIIGVESYQANAFDEEDERLLVTIADQVAVVIQNVRLFEETRRRAERLDLLNRIGRAVSQTLDLDELLQIIYQEIATALTVDAFFMAFYDAVTNELDFRIQVDAGIRETPTRIRMAPSQSERVIATRKPVLIRNWEQENQFSSAQRTLWGTMKRAVSWLGVPMLIGDKVIGIICVQAYTPNMYGEEEERLLATIADQVSLAVQNARLFDETRRRLNDLEAVNTISVALRLAQRVEEMVPLLLDETLKVFDMTAGQIALYDPATNELRVAAARGWCIDTPKVAGANDGIAGLVFGTAQPYVTREFKPDAKTSELARIQIPERWGGAIIPIRTGQEVTGVLAVSVQLPREITQNEVRLLTLIAEIAGNAIHRAALHEQTEQRLQRLDALHMIDTAIGASLDLRVTLNILLDQVLTQLRVDATAILLLNPFTQTLEYTAGRGFRANVIEHLRVRMGQEYAGRAAIERRVIFIPDLLTTGANGDYAELIASEAVVSYCAAPLISKGQIKGVLEIFHRNTLRPDSEWLDFVETLAGQTAIAIENAALFNSLQQSNFDISLAYDATIEGWARTLDLRDQESGERAPRVAEMTLRLARALGVHDADLVHIRRGALLHNIGRMGIPDRILLKRQPLTAEEEQIMRRHPQLAYDLLSPIAYLRQAIDIPYCHHENWDGTGFPRGLKGEQIPLAARIFAVAEAWNELRMDRPGRARLSFDAAQQQIRDRAGTCFDPLIVEKLFSVLDAESD